MSQPRTQEEKEQVARNGITDGAVIYQLDKVDQGGAVMELFEDRVHYLAEEWGFPVTDESGEIVLPDGRLAGLSFDAYIREMLPGEVMTGGDNGEVIARGPEEKRVNIFMHLKDEEVKLLWDSLTRLISPSAEEEKMIEALEDELARRNIHTGDVEERQNF